MRISWETSARVARDWTVFLAERGVRLFDTRAELHLFLKVLVGLCSDGREEPFYRGRTTARNAAVGGFALSSGVRHQEFTYLPACEVPALPRCRSTLPIRVSVPAGITKGRKFRTTWTSYDALARLHQYFGMRPTLAAMGSSWRTPSHWGTRWW